MNGEDQPSPSTATIFSAKALDKDVQQGMACGADAYICKPFKAQELLDEVQRLLKTKISEGG